ncbi:MAG: hypothetical protein WC637_05050 [Victivallales bacterium]|jgi:hypothetical protein
MPKYTYPLVKYSYDDGTMEKFAIHTFVPVKISNPRTGQSKRIYGLADTGADKCLLPADLTMELGHNLNGVGVKGSLNIGIEQREVQVYLHTFKIELLAPDEMTSVWSSPEIEVDCSESDPPVLLGALDFLRNFKLTVDYSNEQLILEW